jgi:hypothetical protein
MRLLKNAVFIVIAVAGFSASPAMAMLGNEAAEVRNNEDSDVRPVKKQRENPGKPDTKQAPKKEACRSCRILM